MSGFKILFKIYSHLWIFILEIFHDFYYNEELNYQFVFSSPPHFSKLYMHYTYTYISEPVILTGLVEIGIH